MKKIFKLSVSAFLSAVILFSVAPFSISSAASLDLNKSCALNVKSGWNLIGLAELSCGLMKIEDIPGFPAYLDMYGYDGNEYIYGRITKQELRNAGGRSFETAAQKYLNKLVKKITANTSGDFDDFSRTAGKDIEQNNTEKIKEYAGRLSKEIFTSIWVYNPGKNFSVEYFPKYKDDALGIFAIRALATDINSSDLSQFMNYIEEEILPEMSRELERQPGYSAFAKELVSGKVILDSGWNFLSYSRLLSDDNGRLNFSSGTCKISKAYIFDDNEKKWMNAENANRSMIGSGMVVYNSGSKCIFTPENSILSGLKSILRGGADNNPPSLPGSDSTPPPILPN